MRDFLETTLAVIVCAALVAFGFVCAVIAAVIGLLYRHGGIVAISAAVIAAAFILRGGL